MSPDKSTNDYDLVPVFYCSKCYSLKIMHEDYIASDFCGDCGCTDIRTCYIDEWERMYKNRYGHPYVVKNNSIRNSPLYRMDFDELKKLLYNSTYLTNIVHDLYATFPEGLVKEEIVLLLFDKVLSDNRLDELKSVMFNYLKRQGNEPDKTK